MMFNNCKAACRLENDRGAVIVTVAILIFVLLGITAIAIDISYRHVIRNELQNAADSAALASAREMTKIYQTVTQPYTFQSADVDKVFLKAQEMVKLNLNMEYLKNQEIDKPLTIDSSDIVLGKWDPITRTVTATFSQPDAVQVTARRDDKTNGPVSTFFAQVFNIKTMAVTASATAALSGPSFVDEGGITIPIGISKKWFDRFEGSFCGDVIAFAPTTDPDACAGWTTFEYKPAQPNTLIDLLDGKLLSPPADLTSTFLYNNGNLNNQVYHATLSALERNGYDVNFVYDPSNPNSIPAPVNSLDERVPLYGSDGEQLRYPPCSGASGKCSGDLRYAREWKANVIVYDSDVCNPNQSIKVAGFARVVVFDVGQSSDKTVKARIDCGYIIPESRGGGPSFGTMGAIPGLVK